MPNCGSPRCPSARGGHQGLGVLLLLCAVPAVAQSIKLSAPLDSLQRVVQTDSNDALAHYFVALGYWGVSDFDRAERELKEAVALDRRLAEGYLALAYLPYARRPKLWEEEERGSVPAEWKPKLEESDRMYRRAFLVNPLVDLRITAAALPGRDALWSLTEEARQAYDFMYQGFDDLSMGDYADAYKRLDRLVLDVWGRRHPDQIPGYVIWYRGLAAAHLPDHQREAIRDFRQLLDRSLKQEGKDSVLHVPLRTNEYRYMLAVLQDGAGVRDTAEAFYRAAIENDLGLYMAHVRLADLYEREQRPSDALNERFAAVDASPDDPSLLFDLAVTAFKTGNLTDARKALTQATQLSPRGARLWYVLGIVDQRLGDRDASRAEFTRFLALAPSRMASQVADAKQRLATLQ
jgi:tetratricopeptide (TPR) repeat protein